MRQGNGKSQKTCTPGLVIEKKPQGRGVGKGIGDFWLLGRPRVHRFFGAMGQKDSPGEVSTLGKLHWRVSWGGVQEEMLFYQVPRRLEKKVARAWTYRSRVQ